MLFILYGSIHMKRLTLIMITFIILSGCSNSLTKNQDIPTSNKLSALKLPKISLPSWMKPSLPSVTIYKSNILQGSILNIEDVNKLKIGMSKNTVLETIGSPSISDPFHQYQWDYINHSYINNDNKIHYRLRLIFTDNALTEIDKSGLEEI